MRRSKPDPEPEFYSEIVAFFDRHDAQHRPALIRQGKRRMTNDFNIEPTEQSGYIRRDREPGQKSAAAGCLATPEWPPGRIS